MTFNPLGAQGDADVVSEHAGWAARIDQLRPDVLVLQASQSDSADEPAGPPPSPPRGPTMAPGTTILEG